MLLTITIAGTVYQFELDKLGGWYCTSVYLETEGYRGE